ncbi:MAG: hypothetical protein HFJ65_01740 [Eggerthellaceae bacterium]|nr:hypothetical protein [Eggerthellaceae bacterium]
MRERIALVVFLVLVLAGGIVLTSYFSTGRGWSVAATAVDDSVGQLDDYVAVVYSGVAEEAPIEPADIPDEEADEDIAADREMGLGLKLLTLATEVGSADEGRVFVSDVRELYETRGASVLSLDLSGNGSRYAAPQVFHVGNKAIGVFSVSERLPRKQVDEIVSMLKEDGATCIICIAPRPSLISTYEGIDVALIMQADHEYSVENSPEDLTVIAKSPNVGNVGVILLTSNNIPSTKSVQSL